MFIVVFLHNTSLFFFCFLVFFLCGSASVSFARIRSFILQYALRSDAPDGVRKGIIAHGQPFVWLFVALTGSFNNEVSIPKAARNFHRKSAAILVASDILAAICFFLIVSFGA